MNFKKMVSKTTVSGQKKTSYTGKNFTKGKRYYVKVRAYKTVNGNKIYGALSNERNVKANYSVVKTTNQSHRLG